MEFSPGEARGITDAMQKLKEDPLFKNNSAEIGSMMKQEDGVGRAVEIIEEVLQKSYTK